MLSRIAESLFWVGRYMERAEDTARILDVHVHHLLEDPWVDEDAACRALLAVMSAQVPPGPLDGASVTRCLAFDPGSSSSIVGSLTAAREGARGAREAISSEMWECLNGTYNAIPSQVGAAQAFGPHQFFDWVKERSAVLAGLADATLSRDDGWRFLTLGRQLERVDMTARLLSARFADTSTSPEWVTTLRCCSAHEAYLRTYRRAVDTSLAAEFLLLDRLFPRSVYYALDVVERRLAELAPDAGRVGAGDDARRLIGRVRTELEFRTLGDLLVDLPAVLAEIQAAGSATSAAVAARYFHHNQPVQWTA
jgi:uncharacterized alpha-E superfamily protein